MTYPNVYLDFTWLPTISPLTAERVVPEAVDTVNAGKLCGGGGDAWTCEEAYAALRTLRLTVERALRRLVARRRLAPDQAVCLARGILHDHAARLYGRPAKTS
jgi:hypothetical protein